MSQSKKSSFLTFSLFSFCVIGLCMGLGVWQLQRLEWKNKLLQSVANTDPTSYSLLAADSSIEEFSKVVVTGNYLPNLEIRLEPRMHERKLGAHLLTPLLKNHHF